MQPVVSELISLLDESASFLETYRELPWSNWLRNNADLIKKDDASGFETLFRGFGGMGSFNDLVLHPMNNHRLSEAEINTANTKLEEYRREIYRLISNLRRDSWKHSE